MSHRIAQINELLKQKLNSLITETGMADAADCLITITSVDTSRDLGQAKVYVSIMPQTKEKTTINQLAKKAGFYRHQLIKILSIRKVPKLMFYADHAQQKVSRIDQLIDKIHQGQ